MPTDATTPTQPPGARRPIKARQSRWAAESAARLVRWGITPDTISVGSILFGAEAGVCLVLIPRVTSPWMAALLLAGAIAGIQARLICNLLDGMVAVEGGKGGKSGEVFNDFPDRVADPLILIAAGYAATGWHAVEMGWAAALLAVMTAYVRVLGRSIGGGVCFIGPMAKQHRMALLTAGCVVAAVAAFWHRHGEVLYLVLVIINAGCVATVARRLRWIVADLERK